VKKYQANLEKLLATNFSFFMVKYTIFEFMKICKSKNIALVLFISFFCLDIFLAINYLRNGIGFRPKQNVSFSHKLHTKYKITCLFCHYQAETHSFANLPTTKTCMICHIALRTESQLLKNVIASYDSSIALGYQKVYDLPDYVRFSHSLHIRSGIDCATCHGFVDQMDSIYQVRNLTMGWCVDCHKNPENYLIPPRSISGIFYPNDPAFNQNKLQILLSSFPSNILQATFPIPKKIINASVECSTCHN
jgi:hypothetical protein